jgi:hypothetical protein
MIQGDPTIAALEGLLIVLLMSGAVGFFIGWVCKE